MSDQPADEISSDLDALRELERTHLRVGWLRQFAAILLLVSAFVVIVWFGTTRSTSPNPVVFYAGVGASNEVTSIAWVGPALEQAMVAIIQSGEQLRLINPGPQSATNAFFAVPLAPSVQSRAQWVLRTSLLAGESGSDTVVVRLELSRSGDVAATHSADIVGSAHSISDLASRNVEQLLAWLELDGVSPQQLGFAIGEIPLPVSSEAYGRGVVAMTNGDGHSALTHFSEADALAPNNAAIHEGLANAWSLLGYAINAANEAKLAYEARDGLSRRRQLELEARLALRMEEWPRAQQVFAALKEFNPHELSYRLALANSQARQNDSDGFAETVRQMRAMKNDIGSDPRIDLTEAAYWFETGDYQRCFDLAKTAETKAISSGDRRLLAEALLTNGRCDGSNDPAVLLQARQVFSALNLSSREPFILRELAKHEFAQGDMQTYLAYSEEAVRKARELGNEPEIAAAQNALAIAYDLHGWLKRGYKLKQQVANYQKQRNNMNRYSILLENIGISLFKLGRYDEATTLIDQAEKIFVEIDDQIGIAWLPYRRGQIALRRGDLDTARELMTQALQNAAERPEGNLAIEATFELGLMHFFSGNYATATEHLEAASQFFREQEMSVSVAESEIVLARIAFQTSKHVEALQHLANAEQQLTKEVAYYAMSLRAEQTIFGTQTPAAELSIACDRLLEIVAGQEHMENLLRAKAKIVACYGFRDKQAYALSDAMLAAVETEAQRLGLFEPMLTAGYVRAALLREAGRDEDARTENKRVNAIAAIHQWKPHPIPDLAL